MPTRRILVADDNHDFADSLVQLLEAAGYDATAAYDGMAAVVASDALHPALALLDVQMPRLDGCEAARRIRRQPDRPLRIASLSGLSPDMEPMKSMGCVFDAHFQKPARPAALLAYVREALGEP